MKITAEQLAAATGGASKTAARFLDSVNTAMEAHGITTAARVCAFLAQIGHESGGLRYTREIWGPTPAQMRYEGRHDLGNNHVGDGVKYRGRGLIQITGRTNYERMSKLLGLDLLEHPELLETLSNAAMSAAAWWEAHGLNGLADSGSFDAITRVINGGTNGAAQRRELWAKAKAAIHE